MKTQLAYSFLLTLLVSGCGSDTTPSASETGGSGGGAGYSQSTEAGGDGTIGGDASSGGMDANAGSTASGGANSTGGVATTGGSEATGGSQSTSGTCVTTYYRDADGDTWGGTETSCTTAAGWVTRTGDCNDSNIKVFPSQTLSFTTPYDATNGTHSFDYDCDGTETVAGGTPISTGECQPSGSGNSCIGDGYLPVEPARSGAELNQVCGSMRYLVCSRSQLLCIAATSVDGTYDAASCR